MNITYHASFRAAGDANADLFQTLFKLPGKSVDVRKFGEVVRESERCRRGEHTGLPHGTTKKLSEPPCLVDEFARADKARTDRCT